MIFVNCTSLSFFWVLELADLVDEFPGVLGYGNHAFGLCWHIFFVKDAGTSKQKVPHDRADQTKLSLDPRRNDERIDDLVLLEQTNANLLIQVLRDHID